jgi:hypothetical protein
VAAHGKTAIHGVEDAFSFKCVVLDCTASASITYWPADCQDIRTFLNV